MNLVMQFRKVCNHPELFERRNNRSSYLFGSTHYKTKKGMDITNVVTYDRNPISY